MDELEKLCSLTLKDLQERKGILKLQQFNAIQEDRLTALQILNYLEANHYITIDTSLIKLTEKGFQFHSIEEDKKAMAKEQEKTALELNLATSNIDANKLQKKITIANLILALLSVFALLYTSFF